MHGGDLPLLLFKALDETLTCETNHYQNITEIISLYICELNGVFLLQNMYIFTKIHKLSGTYISIPFIFATILVYICLAELRNTHGKCLIFYLICRAVSSMVANLYLIQNVDLIFVGFYLLMSSTQWLQVISFDIWWNLRTFR